MEDTDRKHRRARRRQRNLVQKDSKFRGYNHAPVTKYNRKSNKRVIDAGLDIADN
jgi:hypothetical protein